MCAAADKLPDPEEMTKLGRAAILRYLETAGYIEDGEFVGDGVGA